MDAQKLQLKIFVTAESARAVQPEAFIPIFHRWIKEDVLPDLVVDVTNYLHVPEGPGVVLIGHGSDYSMDLGEGRLGFLYSRKRGGPPAAEGLDDLVRRTFHAAALLEREPALGGKLRFATHSLLFRINDRLATPNREATFAGLKSELERFASAIFGGPSDVTLTGGPKDLFSVRLSSPAAAPLETLLARVGGAPSLACVLRAPS